MSGTKELKPVGLIDPSPTNPRRRFDADKLQDLAASILANGLIQPIIVRPKDAGRFELVCGERRLRATKLAEIPTIDVIVKELTDSQVLEAQFSENADREDVHPLDEGEHFRRMIDAGVYGAGVEAIDTIAKKVGKSRRFVYSRMELAKLIEPAKEAFIDGEITLSHAVELARLTEGDQDNALQTINEEEMSSRDFIDWISEHVHRDLSRAKFSLALTDLLPQVPACMNCPKRTVAEAEACGEVAKEDRCLDSECFEAKTEADIELRIKNALKANPGSVRLTSDWRNLDGALNARDFRLVNAGDEGSEIGIWIDQPRAGQVAYFVRHAAIGATGSVSEASTPSAVAATTQGSTATAETEQQAIKRVARREELRGDRTQRIFRKELFDKILCLLSDDFGGNALTGKSFDLLLICSAKLALHMAANTDFASESGHLKHPGMNAPRQLLGFVGEYNYPGIPGKGIVKTLEGVDAPVMHRALFIALTADELHHQDYAGNVWMVRSRPEPFALLAYAKWFAIDVDEIFKRADFSTLTKKQQAEHAAAKQSEPEKPQKEPESCPMVTEAPEPEPAPMAERLNIRKLEAAERGQGKWEISQEILADVCEFNCCGRLAEATEKRPAGVRKIFEIGGKTYACTGSASKGMVYRSASLSRIVTREDYERAAKAADGKAPGIHKETRGAYMGQTLNSGGQEWILAGKAHDIELVAPPRQPAQQMAAGAVLGGVMTQVVIHSWTYSGFEFRVVIEHEIPRVEYSHPPECGWTTLVVPHGAIAGITSALDRRMPLAPLDVRV